MSDIVERLWEADKDPQATFEWSLLGEAAMEIERLRRQLNRHEWAESADRALMEEEIEQLRKDVQNLNRDCTMLAGKT